MFDRIRIRCGILLCVGGLAAGRALAGPLHIVAAENFYGDVARQLAGPDARITSVLRNPAADPHLFEPDPATARALASANLIIYNGAGYDPWMPRLLRSAPLAGRQVIEVAALLPALAATGNPHLWYDPATMPMLARALSARLAQLDAAHAGLYQQRLQRFLASLQPIDARIRQLRARYAGTAVTATEPVIGDLTAALGLVTRNQRFQLAIMNNTEPGARETAAFEDSLRRHQVRLLIYNRQTSDDAVQRLRSLAGQLGIPTVAVTETEPPGVFYQQWMQQVLGALGQALAGPEASAGPHT